jgi:hypothetical protein
MKASPSGLATSLTDLNTYRMPAMVSLSLVARPEGLAFMWELCILCVSVARL